MTVSTERVCRVLIEGRVQGVGFRAWVKAQAQGRRLAGWVRNRSDGAVEAVFAGPQATVAEMIEACHGGPALAKVSHVAARDTTREAASVDPDGRFHVRPTE